MKRIVSLLGMLAVLVLPHASGAEEKIRGLLEKTVKPGACAQITDALSEVYYITKTDDACKAVEKFLGKNEKVVITGIVESKEGDPSYYFNLKTVEPYAPKLPPPPAPAATAPAATENKGDAKTDAKPAEPAPTDAPKK